MRICGIQKNIKHQIIRKNKMAETIRSMLPKELVNEWDQKREAWLKSSIETKKLWDDMIIIQNKARNYTKINIEK